MKAFLSSFLVVAALVLTGCDMMPGQSGGRPGPPPAKTRSFQADPRAVYEAARVALAQMEFRVTGGGPSQGRIEAVSGVSTRDSLQGARQITLSVRITALDDGGSEVSANFKEAIEQSSDWHQGFATETPLRDTPYSEVFFTGLAQALAAPKKN
jgi:hypothetical protein